MTIDHIRDYVKHEVLKDPTAELGDDDDLLLSGTMDSLDVVRLVEHLESQSGTKIPAADVTLENFGSLRKIADYLASRSA